MVRTQIQLTEEQARSLRRLAADQGISAAELIRRSIDAYVRDHDVRDVGQQRQRALSIIGKYASDATNVSVSHDQHLAEIYGQVHE